jgi:hypothetical protein
LAVDGAVHVAGVVDAATCRRLHVAIARCRAAPSEHHRLLSSAGQPPVDSDLFRWFDDPDIAAVVRHPALVELAASLLRADAVVLVEDQWFASAPGATTASPWHHDDPYYNIDGGFLTLWLALDDAPAAAALQVVPGSHRWGRLFAPVEFSAGARTIGAGGPRLEPVPDIDADPDGYGVVGWDVAAGDVIALDARTLHAAGRAGVGQPFRRLSIRYAPPTARYVERGPQVADFWDRLPHGRRPATSWRATCSRSCPSGPFKGRATRRGGSACHRGRGDASGARRSWSTGGCRRRPARAS